MKARAAGVDMFMRKPIFANAIQEAFENVLLNKKEAPHIQTPLIDYDFTGKRVLLVEDNDINAEIAQSILEMKHCQVELAGNGAEAVESFASVPLGYYDAILMDVRMPIMDGLEATRTIRAMRKASSKTIPIIAMTANAFQEDINISLESGMNAHLAKPIEPATLYAALDKVFKKAKK
jgi:CheY-like chemotaxis protein